MGGSAAQPEGEASQIQFRLSGMDVNDFSFDSEPEHTNFEQGGYLLQHALTASEDDNLILVRVRATLQSVLEDGDGTGDKVNVGSVSVTGSFEIRNLEEREDSEGDIQLPNEFVANLLGIVISTVRGVLLAHGSGTPIEKNPLPIINPLHLIESTDYVEHEESPQT